MKYDDASWHYGGNFPPGLPDEAGATHIAMFVAWCVLNGFGGEIHTEDGKDLLAKLECRTLTPGQWFLSACDGKFTDEDLTAEGNEFARAYYGAGGELASDPESFLADYELAFPTVNDLYEVPDNWGSFDIIAPIIASRLNRYREPNWMKRWF